MIDDTKIERLDRPGRQHHQVVEAYLEEHRYRPTGRYEYSLDKKWQQEWLAVGPFGDGGQQTTERVARAIGPKHEWTK